jgi:hypothetical protein
LEWGDKRRFLDCVNALFDHRIVDKKKYNFTDRRGPHIERPQQTAAARRQKEDIACIERIRFLREQDPDLSERSACKKVAAESGRSASFEAEWGRLRQLSRQARDIPSRRRDRVGKRPRT